MEEVTNLRQTIVEKDKVITELYEKLKDVETIRKFEIEINDFRGQDVEVFYLRLDPTDTFKQLIRELNDSEPLVGGFYLLSLD